MNFRRIKHMLFRLSPEEKLAGIGAIIVLISCFLPWFSITFSSTEKSTAVSGFAGDLGVIGFVVFLLTTMAITFLIAEHLNLRIPGFGFKKEQIVLFLMGESAFLLLLTIAVYTKRSFEYTNAELRFGLYAALIGAFAGTFAAFAQTQKSQKKETEAFFEHPEEVMAETDEIVDTTTEEPEYKEQEYMPKKEEVAVEPVKAEQKNFFYKEDQEAEIAVEAPHGVPEEETEEETPVAETAEPEGDVVETSHGASPDETDNETTAEPQEETPEETPVEEPVEQPEEAPDEILAEQPEEEPASDDTAETVEASHGVPNNETNDEPTDEPSTDEPKTPPLSADMGQGDYLIREAGVQKSNIKVNMDSIKKVNVETMHASSPEKTDEKKEVKTAKDSKPATKTMGFYDDI